MTADEPGIVQTLGAHGACPTITHSGATYTVGHPTQRAKAELELLVLKAARDNVEDAKAALTAEEYAAEQAALRVAIQTGAYKTWKPLWAAMWDGLDRIPMLLCACIKTKHPDFTLAQMRVVFAQESEQCLDALDAVMPPFFALLMDSLPVSAAGKEAEATAALKDGMDALRAYRRSQSSTTS